jgi:phenol 2-monooxygenase (NADPH)
LASDSDQFRKMAKSVMPSKWTNGFRELGEGTPWAKKTECDEEPHYVTPPSAELLTSPVHNSLGLNVMRTWPTIYDGTNSPHGLPLWWKPEKEVDVLIAGAGPSGLQVAVSLARQGVSFRLIGQYANPTQLALPFRFFILERHQ